MALHIAMHKGHADVVQALLSAGAKKVGLSIELTAPFMCSLCNLFALFG